jgi:hypothetical protein
VGAGPGGWVVRGMCVCVCVCEGGGGAGAGGLSVVRVWAQAQ